MKSEALPHSVDGRHRIERRRAQRFGVLRWTWVSYCMDSLLLALFAWVDAVPMRAAIIEFLGGSILCLAFLVLFLTELNERFRDPYLATPQMVCSSFLLLWIATLVPEATMLMITVLFVVLAFAALRLHGRWLFAMWFVLSIALVAVLAQHPGDLALPDHTPTQVLLSGIWVSLVLGRCAFIGLYGATIRKQLGQRNRELAETQDRLETLVRRDVLTEALNRRAIMDALDGALESSPTTRTQVAVVLADLDEFKSINDRHGHAVGDAVLQRFVETAGRVLRASDHLGRYGGEEFMFVLSRAGSVTAAAIVAERVRDSLSRETFDDVAPGLRVTASFGVAAAGAGEAPEAIVKRADEAMYRAKAAGRNRVTVAT